MDELSDLIQEVAAGHARSARAGMIAGEERGKSFIRAILIAYDRALSDSKFIAPSYLHATLESARRFCQDDVNAYANAMIKRDQEMPEWERELRTGGRE